MRATEHERVDVGRLAPARAVARRARAPDRSRRRPASTNSTKPGTRRARELERRRRARRPPVGTRPTRSCRPCRSRRRGRCASTRRAARSPGLDHADDGNVELVAQVIERGGRRAVARDHDHLHVVLEQQVDDLERVLQDLVGGLRAVREIGRCRRSRRRRASGTRSSSARTTVSPPRPLSKTPDRPVVADIDRHGSRTLRGRSARSPETIARPRRRGRRRRPAGARPGSRRRPSSSASRSAA